MIDAPRDRLDSVGLPPFKAGIEAGARMVMSSHVAVVSALTGRASLPATLSRAVMTDVLRGELGFDGVSISDALDMRALAQGAAQAVDIIATVRAGIDLLLCAPDREAQARIEATLVAAADRGVVDPDELRGSLARIKRCGPGSRRPDRRRKSTSSAARRTRHWPRSWPPGR